MKKHVNLILVLMALCVVGIIGLQWFWNYQNYKSTINAFHHDINQSLTTAVDLEIAQRHQGLIDQVKGWLADTSLIQITCDTKNRDRNTVFHIQDRYPKYAGSPAFTFGLASFKPQLDHMTPAAKQLVINHFSDTRLRRDLQRGTIYYYTQRLGDSLTVAFDKSHVRMNALATLYQQQLRSKGIYSAFRFKPDDPSQAVYLTEPVNTALARPYRKEWVRASLESPNRYFLRAMKWVILSTLLLTAISLLCFGYTAKTLLSQQKLAQLKTDFINNMTHELNTPLTSIKITAEALNAFDHPADVRKRYVAIISYQAEKLTHLTAQILSTNRGLVTNQEDWQLLEVSGLIDQAIEDLEGRSQHQLAILRDYIQGDPIRVYGQAASLLNVFANIMDNALKYGSATPELAIKLATNNKWVDIAFADNGPGIPPEYSTKVFDAFFRVPQGNVHDVKGYGLGLSYVRQVLHQHRGSITVEPNQPTGSVFRIKLPLY
ncbi:HAMP domain-containing sensor histidine kinase [Spirosoma sp.]|uniref:sensor histidine kinase n=1 Tax=Spirosoma sp. TaxID=1899569 RepID=UPI00262FEFB1|nr:HAMP domain-containing sensor histidine kinase [Spirosoma sp.]MCX6213681.1 HAMP domain-containing sensor histidine kinase [Spirosoma sp.]